MLPSGSFVSIHAPFHNNLEWSEHRGQRFRCLPVTTTRVFIYYSFESCARGKRLVCELSLNVSEADTSVSHHASLNSGNDVDMSVYPERANVHKDCCHFSYLLPSSHNNSTDLITEKYKRLLPIPIILCSRVPEDEAEVSLCFYSGAGVICSVLTLCTVPSAFNVRLLNSFLLLFFSM